MNHFLNNLINLKRSLMLWTKIYFRIFKFETTQKITKYLVLIKVWHEISHTNFDFPHPRCTLYNLYPLYGEEIAFISHFWTKVLWKLCMHIFSQESFVPPMKLKHTTISNTRDCSSSIHNIITAIIPIFLNKKFHVKIDTYLIWISDSQAKRLIKK